MALISSITWSDNTARKTKLFCRKSGYLCEFATEHGYCQITMCVKRPPAEPEITDDLAIKHLQSTGWLQNHDKEMHEMGLRERLADDSGSYDSLIPSGDSVPISWIEKYIDWLNGLESPFSTITALQVSLMVKRWKGDYPLPVNFFPDGKRKEGEE